MATTPGCAAREMILGTATTDDRGDDGIMPKTLSEKIWDAHVVHSAAGEPDLLYIDLHLVHEVTSPQAFDGLRQAGRPAWRRPSNACGLVTSCTRWRSM